MRAHFRVAGPLAIVLILATALAALAAAGGVAYAMGRHWEPGVIHGCRDKTTGALRALDARRPTTCYSSETRLDWNQTGVPGPPGPPGPPGTTAVFTSLGSVGGLGGDEQTIDSLDVPPGAYVLFGKVSFFSFGGFAHCHLYADENSDFAGITTWSMESSVLPLLLTHEFTSAGTVTVACAATQPQSLAVEARIVAMKVGSLTGP